MFSKKLLLGSDIEIPEFEYPVLYEGDIYMLALPQQYSGVSYIGFEENNYQGNRIGDISPQMFRYTGPDGRK